MQCRTKDYMTFALSTDKHNNRSKISFVIVLKGLCIRFR